MSDRNDRNRRNAATEEVCCVVCDTDDNGSAEAAAADAESEAVETVCRRESDFSEPVCINTNQIYDSCRDRDCVTDARVYFTESDQEIVDNAINAKLKKAEIIWVYTNVEPLSFNNGYFSVDLKFFVRTTLEIFSGVSCPVTVCGLTTFDKRVILFGSEGKSKVFKSNPNEVSDCDIASSWQNTSMPTVVVETVDPIALSAEIVEKDCCGGCGCGCDCDCDCNCDCDCDDDDEDYFDDDDFEDEFIADGHLGDTVPDDHRLQCDDFDPEGIGFVAAGDGDGGASLGEGGDPSTRIHRDDLGCVAGEGHGG